ncbi:MAG: 2-hydroxyacyl-CoA dehydratase [Tissierellia bacterium]|nr:2-hydroxyacyl-CoA dehydratase [Tissierellia bacterium]
MEIKNLLAKFKHISDNPKEMLDKYISNGEKVIGCFPYYVPEELVEAAGMVPFGVWGGSKKISLAKEYFASFYCSLAQMNLEMGLNGTLDKLSGIIVTTLCDTLRPLSQNFRVGVPNIPFLFLNHPQNRKEDFGITYTKEIYSELLEKLVKISGHSPSDEDFVNAYNNYNESRALRREFVKLAGKHPDKVSAVNRSAVLRSAYFMKKKEHSEMLKELNELLKKEEVKEWDGVKIVTSGIMVENKALLEILDKHKVAIVADDVAHESRAIRVDVDLNEKDRVLALAKQFANQDDDTILYDPTIYGRPKNVANLVKESGAQGVIIFMMNFCDPEEMEYVSLKKELEEEGIPMIKIGIDLQMEDFGQAETSIQAFTDVIDF